MSEYSYRSEPKRYRSTRVRERERDEPEYVEETTFIQRGKGAAPIRDLVYRPRDDSVEDIQRDFPPPRGKAPRRARSVGRDDYYSEYDSEEDYYEGPRRRGRPSRRDSDGYYSDDHGPRRERRKSRVGEVLEDLGLGGIAGAFLGGKEKERSRSRNRRDNRDNRSNRRRNSSSSSSSSSSPSREPGRGPKWQHAARAALAAGAVEAFRSRKTPGPWKGQKGTRVATAALSAAGIDGLVDRGSDGHHSKRHTAEAVIGGLVSNRLVNGSRSQSRGRARSLSASGDSVRSRSRSIMNRVRSMSRGRSQSRPGEEGEGKSNGLRNLAAGGAIAAVGKTIYDRVRSKSRRRRSPSNSSNDSYVPTRGRRYRGGDIDDRGAGSRGMNDGPADDRGMGGQDYQDDYQQGYQQTPDSGAMMRGGGGGATSNKAASVSSESTTDMEMRRKRMRGKEFITAGLATVATIHAVHGVYNSVSASEKRHKLVQEGEMSPEEARKKRSKAFLQDAAAIGIAALGIKGAFSEWKEMNEHRQEVKQLEVKRRKRRKLHEQRQKAMQQAFFAGGPGMGGMGPGQQGGYGAPQYADGNPYASGNLPPPPMGGPDQRY